VKNRRRVVHRYRVDPLFPEDVAYLFGGATGGQPVSLVSGNGIEFWRGQWSSEKIEAALRGHDIALVIGTPDSIGVNQIAVRNPKLLHPLDTVDEVVSTGGASRLARAVKMMPKTVLPTGTTLFHVTDAMQTFAIPRGPAFFTDHQTSKWERRGIQRPGHVPSVERTLRLRVTADVKVLDLSMRGRDKFERLCRAAFGGESYYPPKLAEALRGITAGWIMGSEVMLVDPQHVLEPDEGS
jgi:hypothetical protein